MIYQPSCQGVTIVSPSPPVGGTPCIETLYKTSVKGVDFFYSQELLFFWECLYGFVVCLPIYGVELGVGPLIFFWDVAFDDRLVAIFSYCLLDLCHDGAKD